MFSWPFKKKQKIEEKPKIRNSAFSTEIVLDSKDPEQTQKMLDVAISKSIQRTVKIVDEKGRAMDSNLKSNMLSQQWGNFPVIMSPLQMSWYASQGFIGYQACAIIAQHWLIDKACSMPGEDAIRNGYEITVNDGTEVEDNVLDDMRQMDIKYNINKNLLEFVRFGRIFGIRHALFVVDSTDPEYYLKPFNIDGVEAGSYQGISQIDPYWITPELSGSAVIDTTSIGYYEPTYWFINGSRIHKSHFIIMKTDEVADILKPTYFYGGVPLTQKIYERVYAAERCANEAPQLLLTKRTVVYKTDLAKAMMNQCKFEQRVAFTSEFMDNYGVRVIGLEDEISHLDTNISDLDSVIMTQYQLVASIANVPSDKLLGTSPKGFNATGEYQQRNYHESLESLQTHYLTPLLNRHHELMVKSELCPKYGLNYFTTTVEWSALNSVNAIEQAQINKLEAEKDSVYIVAGVIDAEDVRKKVISNPSSGYNGLNENELPDPLENEEETEELLKGERETRSAQRI